MSQLSRRTGSFNSILGTAPFNNKTEEHYNDIDSNVRRAMSSSNHKLVGKPRNSLVARPVTPVTYRASEAHIHRIRHATSRADLKRNLHLPTTPSKPTSKPKEEVNDSSRSESEDEISIQSINWTAPLDITTYLYKPEYIIGPSSRESMVETASLPGTTDEKTFQKPVHISAGGISKPKSQLVLNLPTVSEGKSSTNFTSDEFTRKNTKREMRGVFNREMSDYSAFIKELNDDLIEISKETRRLETQSFRTKARRQEDRDEVKNQGYVTLKRFYELNPDLTESAAKRNICGPPGKQWMGLSRVEVLEIMRQIRKELDVPPEKFADDYDPRMNFQRRMDKASQKKKGTRKNKKQPKKASKAKERKAKQRSKLKTPVLPIQYVPGRKHLHTNICIRPWEATLDGWNHTNTNDTRDENGCIENEQIQENTTDIPNFSSAEAFPPQNLPTAEHSTSHNDDEDDYLTLEIFNPVFKVYR